MACSSLKSQEKKTTYRSISLHVPFIKMNSFHVHMTKTAITSSKSNSPHVHTAETFPFLLLKCYRKKLKRRDVCMYKTG